jgi:hypothetical protein
MIREGTLHELPIPGMFRVWCLASFLPIAACISSPVVTTIDETRDAPVSPDGPVETIALVEEGDIHEPLTDAGSEDGPPTDGGVLPHPDRDADAGDDEIPKGKPPRKRRP